MKTIDVIIPVYRPDQKLRKLLEMLIRQSVKPDHILLVNTGKEWFDESCVKGIAGVSVIHIRQEEFDHGGTRHKAAIKMQGDYLLFLTQDAVPKDEKLVEGLLEPFADERVAVSYARQLPSEDCSILERYTRSFNYGKESRIKTKEDLRELGIKTFFCSNVCAMYRRRDYLALGGFEQNVIFNEDMIFAGRVIKAGKAVAYCAKARVIHSHNYSGLQQFHRNFDLGVSQAQYPEIFSMAPSEKEGMRMVKKTARYLLKIHRPWLILELVEKSGWKLLGYRLGKSYQKLPGNVILRCTMNPAYWKQKYKI